MKNLNESTITTAVLDSLSGTSDPRLKQVSEALVRHLHAFVQEVRPTTDEWEQGIGFLTRVGHMCTDVRQEFILLSDTLGVSMLVDAIDNDSMAGATETTVLGPFYVTKPPVFENGADISNGMTGAPLLIAGTVTGPDGQPAQGASVDIWHSDDDGYYDIQQEGDLAGRARLMTRADGSFDCRSVVPSFYPIPHDGPVGDMLQAQGRHPYRPAHVHFMISAKGCRRLVTHLFLADDPYLESDVVFGVKDGLVCALKEAETGEKRLSYDFRLTAER